MPEGSGSPVETLDRARRARHAAGNAAVGEFRCRGCGYGVIVQRTLPRCPMCGGSSWEPSLWRPYTRRN